MAQREVQVQRSLQEFFRPDHDHPFPVLLPNGDGQDGSLTVRDRNMVVKRLHQLREAQSETNLCYTLVQHRHQRQTRLLGELNLVQRQLCQRPQWLQRGDMLVTPDSSSSSAWSGHGNGVTADVGTGSGATGGDCEWSHVGEFECGSGCVVAGCGCEGDESATEGKSACKGQATAQSNLQSNLPYCLSECQQHTITTTITATITTTSSSSTATSVAGSFIAADTDKENVLPERQGEADELVGTGGPCQQDCVTPGAGAGAGLCQDEPYDHALCSDCSVVCDLAHDCVRRLRNMQVGNRWGDSYE